MDEKNEENDNKLKVDWKILLIIVLIITIVVGALFVVFSKNNVSQTSNVGNTINKNQSDTITKTEDKKNEEKTTIVNTIGNTNDIQTIELNQTITKEEKYELTMKSSRFGKNIEPPNTSGYYRYYDASDGHQYLEIVYDYKNLSSSDVRADKISSIKIKFNDKYEYSGFAVIEDSDGDFTYSNITSIPALSTGKMHYLIEVPDEVANDTSSIVATINCGQDKYQINLR